MALLTHLTPTDRLEVGKASHNAIKRLREHADYYELNEAEREEMLSLLVHLLKQSQL